jgi:hypothetical protein
LSKKLRNKPASSRAGGVFSAVRQFEFSNSHGFAFSRRDASEVCQKLLHQQTALVRWSGGRRQDACEAPSEAGGEPTSHGKVTVRAQG